jgi:uncharacterized membrane protein
MLTSADTNRAGDNRLNNSSARRALSFDRSLDTLPHAAASRARQRASDMRYRLSLNGQSLAIVVIWLLDAGVSVGLNTTGHFILAMLALALFPAAIIVGLLLVVGVLALASALADRFAPLSQPLEHVR